MQFWLVETLENSSISFLFVVNNIFDTADQINYCMFENVRLASQTNHCFAVFCCKTFTDSASRKALLKLREQCCVSRVWSCFTWTNASFLFLHFIKVPFEITFMIKAQSFVLQLIFSTFWTKVPQKWKSCCCPKVTESLFFIRVSSSLLFVTQFEALHLLLTQSSEIGRCKPLRSVTLIWEPALQEGVPVHEGRDWWTGEAPSIQ